MKRSHHLRRILGTELAEEVFAFELKQPKLRCCLIHYCKGIAGRLSVPLQFFVLLLGELQDLVNIVLYPSCHHIEQARGESSIEGAPVPRRDGKVVFHSPEGFG